MSFAGNEYHPRAVADAIALFFAVVSVVALAAAFDVLQTAPRSDDLLAGGFGALVVSVYLAWRSKRELQIERLRRGNAEAERERLSLRLEETAAKLTSLRGLLAMCSWCKSIRDGGGEWRPLELYLEHHLDAAFTHGVCPECMRVEYPSLFQEK